MLKFVKKQGLAVVEKDGEVEGGVQGEKDMFGDA